MSHPAFLRLGTITCNATDDLTGDQLVGVLGPVRFPIGEFKAGDSRDVRIERDIMPGVKELTILEADATGDDVLGTIDLTKEMDVDREFGILHPGGASYVVNFIVDSLPD